MSNLKEIENLETAIERYEKKETTKKLQELEIEIINKIKELEKKTRKNS